jgi:hypothetical protein
MFAQALHSHSQIVCFREIFNGELAMVQFGVEGYDDLGLTDIEHRERDPIDFLHTRIHRTWPDDTRAVGFKFHYTHHWAFPGILDHLSDDKDIYVLHLQRRNTLRCYVSMKMAEETGVWLDDARPKVTPGNVARALRYPSKAWRRLKNLRHRPPAQLAPSKRKIIITPEEYGQFVLATAMRQATHGKLFATHPLLEVEYVELTENADDTFRRVHAFLGVDFVPPTITTRRQNPEPLRDLIENYDELFAAFENTPEARFFE